MNKSILLVEMLKYFRRHLLFPVVTICSLGFTLSTQFKGEEKLLFNYEFPKEWKINKMEMKEQMKNEQMIQITVKDEQRRDHIISIICEEKEDDFDFKNYLENSISLISKKRFQEISRDGQG
jgi:hypothetical protein